MAVPGLGPGPEWPGALPAKFSDPITGRNLQRRAVDTLCRDGPPDSVSQQGFGAYFQDHRGLIPEKSKKILFQRPSDEYQWRPTKRSLSMPGADHHEAPHGLKAVESAPPHVFSIREKQHLRQVSSKEEHGDRPIGPKTVYRENGFRADEQIAQELDLSNEMQRKERIQHLGKQRNGLDCRSLGDKAYRHPDYESNFHHVGGLVVGSTFHRGSFKKTEARNATSIKLSVGTKRTVRSYEDKQRERELKEEMTEVSNLTKEITHQGAVMPCWEKDLKLFASANYEELDSDDERGVAA